MIKKRYASFLKAAQIAVLITCFHSIMVTAQKELAPIRLRNGERLFPLANARQWLDSMRRIGWGDQPMQVLIQFDVKPTAVQTQALLKTGIALKDALSGNTFTALIDRRITAADLPIAPISITPVKSSWKMISVPTAGNEDAEVLVAFHNEVDAAMAREVIERSGGKLLNSPLAVNNYYEVRIARNKITTLASWYGIKSINPAARDQSLNFESVTATKTNIAQLPVLSGGYGLLGDGMTIGVGDNTSGVNHVDLRDRIINYNPAPYTNHGMHINGIVGGAGTILPLAQGFAPHATLVDHLYNLVWARTGTMLQNHNMTVTNNSYAAVVGNCDYSGVYDGYAQALDTISLQYPEVLHVFASGNDGSMNCPPYVSGFGTVTGGYQPAKNVLVVSQSDKMYDWGVNSSRGPVKDGRLKPEIAAIGTNVRSTRGGDNYLTSGGTSMASPQVAGAAALLEQRYKQLHGNVQAASALIKTLLMNGTVDIGNPGPDFTFGFGMMDMSRSLQMLDSNHYVLDAVADSAQKTFTINVPANTAQVKVMLYWHDIPASTVAGKQLVNDLDLEVISPGAVTTLPLILDPTPANVNNVAVQGVDRLNNVEQVTLNNPSAGTYTIKVKGYDVSGTSQAYVVAYDFIKKGVELTYPTKGATVNSGDSLRIYWNASPDNRSLTLDVSVNNGASWTTIDNNIPAGRLWYVWHPQFVSSNQCLMRLTRNGSAEQFTSGSFVMSQAQFTVLSEVQCPGYMSIHWPPATNATGYQVLQKRGPYLQPVATVTDTTYTFSGLALDSAYYATVIPLISGTPGYRYIAVSRKPDNGTCAGSISNGDLMIEDLITPVTGRQNTSTQLSNSESIALRVRNLDDVPANNYQIAYSLNGGAWQTQSFTSVIAANSSAVVNIPAALNLAAAGNYTLRIAVKNQSMTDPVSRNDTLVKVIRQLTNAPLNLATGFTDGFENSAAINSVKDTLGFTPNERWDFFNSNDTGRLRTFVNNDILISGNRSISLDLCQFSTPVTNFLIGTFNAINYATANDEVRFEFDYKLHGNPHAADSNKVWIRGNDLQTWVPVFSYDLSAAPGQVYNSRSISVTDALIANGQNFSGSTQIRFGQRDSTVIALNNFGTGLTLDNVKLYTVTNDIAVDSMLSPRGSSCNLTSAPVTIRLYNGVTQTLSNIQVFYQLDNQPVVSAIVATLAGKTALNYTFAQQLNGIAPGAHTIKAWAKVTGDTYHNNDTITTIFHHQPLITAFPYLENFESNDGYFFTEGFNGSWQYGTPGSGNVTKAASGTKAWKTNLNGYYNDNELSYLYSPCYDLSGLTKPMLSFSGVLDIEDCGNTLCDAAWVEYTTDGGINWSKLGTRGRGFGWYDNDSLDVWSRQSSTRWKVRSIALPVVSQPLQLRFVLSSDPGTSREGISIDDVHIYNRDFGIYNGPDAGPITQNISGTQYTDFIQGGQLVAQIKPDGQTLGNTSVNIYTHATVDTASDQYYLPRSFMINSAQQPSDSVTARLYVVDAEVDSLVNATDCSTCSKPADVYRLGISKYDDTLQANENGILRDNISGIWAFYNSNKVRWVPYDSGYYAEIRVPSFSEFWFNDGGPQGNLSLPNYTLGNESLIAVYPNPNTTGLVTIAWSAGLERSIDVVLTDLTGRLVKQTRFTSQNGRNVSTFNAGGVAKGVYFIRCGIGDRQFVQKIVFQ